MDQVKPGIYRHYKGGLYLAIATARHSLTGEPYVIYVSMDHGTLNIRPLHKTLSDDEGGWEEKVLLADDEDILNNKKATFVPRFTRTNFTDLQKAPEPPKKEKKSMKKIRRKMRDWRSGK